MILLRDVRQVDARFGLFGHNVNLDTRWVHGLRGTSNRLKNHFAHSQWNF
jgi:hypothetical protein